MEYDLTGQRFGRLVALERSPADGQRAVRRDVDQHASRRNDDHHAVWRCECDCGNVVDVAARDLTSDLVHSCGCLPEGSFDLAGLRFGTLVAVDPRGFNEAGVLLWRCLCDCGYVRVCSEVDLLEDRIVSCMLCEPYA